MAQLHVEIVSVEREIFSGEAEMVIARTTEGEIGVLAGHIPLLGEIAEGGIVVLRRTHGADVTAAVHGGFLSVTDKGVTILAETAELSEHIDTDRATAALRRAQAALERTESEGDLAARRRAEGRLRAVGQQTSPVDVL